MAHVLVTGVAGFIGSSLARELIARGHDVRGIDNLSGGTLSNICDLLPRMAFECADHCDQAGVTKLCRDVEVVFHQGAIPSVPKSVIDPLGSHHSNVNGTLSILLAALEAGVRRVVYAASSSAYGESLVLPKHEGMAAAPISPYAVQKLAGELYMQSFAKMYPIETVCLRYFNVFGPHQAADSPYSGVLAKFITSMLAGKAPTIFGDGSQSRDFTYIQNVVEANILAGFAPADRVNGNVYNIACGVRHSLAETYKILADMLGCEMSPGFAESRAGDIQHSLADIRRATEDLGFRPSVGFVEGLRMTVEWYRTQYYAEGSSSELTGARAVRSA